MTARNHTRNYTTLTDAIPKRQISDEDLASLAEEIEANLLESL